MDREVELINIMNDNVKELMDEHGYEESHIIGIIGSAVAEVEQESKFPTKCDKCYSKDVKTYLGYYNEEALQVTVCMQCNATDIKRYD